jgi:hypothetical protein
MPWSIEFFSVEGAGVPPAGQAMEPSVDADAGRLVEGAAPPGQAIAPDEDAAAGADAGIDSDD